MLESTASSNFCIGEKFAKYIVNNALSYCTSKAPGTANLCVVCEAVTEDPINLRWPCAVFAYTNSIKAYANSESAL